MLVGVDWGGTKIEAIALADDGQPIARLREATPRTDYEGCLATVAAVVNSVEAKAGATGSVGIGIPGSLDPLTGIAKGASSTWLNGRPVEADLRRTLDREIRVANDADCFAVSEAVDGAGADHNVVFAVILGSGAGAGVAIAGRAHHGPNNSAGEWGHNPLPRTSPRSQGHPVIAAGTDAWSDGSRAGHLRATTISTPASIWPPPSPSARSRSWTG
jgi:fructokinase